MLWGEWIGRGNIWKANDSRAIVGVARAHYLPFVIFFVRTAL
jgi:hypothetical protein